MCQIHRIQKFKICLRYFKLDQGWVMNDVHFILENARDTKIISRSTVILYIHQYIIYSLLLYISVLITNKIIFKAIFALSSLLI